jgi:PAS domain S-box-containing protein
MQIEQNNSKEQKAAELEVESFRKHLGPFVVAAETTRMAMIFMDAEQANHPLVFANESFLSLTGYDRKELLGQSFDFLMVRPVDNEALAEAEAAFAGSSESGFEIRFRRKDARVFWGTVFISPVRNKTGDIVQHFASFVDLTKDLTRSKRHQRMGVRLGEVAAMSSPTSGIGKSGNLTATARTVGRDARGARAIARATEVAPIVAEIQAAGVTSLHGIARALNTRGVPTATGRGTWEAPQVRRVLARLK